VRDNRTKNQTNLLGREEKVEGGKGVKTMIGCYK
jgi:hypothetical protein